MDRLWWMRGPLREGEGEGTGGGGGTGAGTGDGEKPPPFDPVAFRTEMKTELMTEIRKDLNGIAKNLPKDVIKAMKEAGGFPGDKGDKDKNKDKDEHLGPDGKPISGDAAVNAELAQLRRGMTTLTEENKQFKTQVDQERSQRLETERQSQVRTALGSIPFKDDQSRQLFFDANIHRITRDDDGALIVNTDKGPLPYVDFLKAQAETMPMLLAPKGGGGAGTGKQKNGQGFDAVRTANDLASGAISMEEFSKLPPEQKAAVWSTTVAGARGNSL